MNTFSKTYDCDYCGKTFNSTYFRNVHESECDGDAPVESEPADVSMEDYL